MKIGSHDVTDRVFVIAEIGINHNGDAEIARRMQEAAAESGADAVKYQVGDPYTYVNQDRWYQQRQLHDGRIVPYIEYRCGVELGDDELVGLREHAHGLGLEWFASPLDIPAVARLSDLDVPCFKVASPMVTDLELLKVIAGQGRPVITSSGMTTPEALDAAVTALGWHNVAILHCTSEYPCPPEHCNLNVIRTLQERFPGRPIGYSGHEKGIPETLAAVALGARIIERHFTLDRAMWGSDQAASLEPGAFARMVGYLRTIERALGDGHKIIYPEERANESKFRRVPLLDGSDKTIVV